MSATVTIHSNMVWTYSLGHRLQRDIE